MTTFQQMGLPDPLMQALKGMGFETPTPVQAQAIPVALLGKDILGSAQTGTGKTGAFGIPLVAKLLLDAQGLALVMTPTRELATQVMGQIHALLGKKSKIKTALLIGGESMFKQFSQLRQHPRVIVGTPGRINDHLNRGTLNLKAANFLVLDETDRMLDMGFTPQIEAIMAHMESRRQTLLFSATLPKNIVQIAEKYLTEPVRVSVASEVLAAPKIKQETFHIQESDKYLRLTHQLDERQGSVLVFVKTKYGAEKMAAKLLKEGHRAEAIHGDLRQNKRDRVISGFRNKKYRILVATDVAARGLDIPHIEHVINYDLPQCAEDYIHRIGRTARAGAEGSALNLVAPADKSKWYAIERLLNPNAPVQKKQPKVANSSKKRSFRGKSNGKPKGDFSSLKKNPMKKKGPKKNFGRASKVRMGKASD